MPTSNLYSVASGQCLVRGTSEIKESERACVQREFHNGILFILDPDRREIRGIVPARRRTQELFYAVVRFSDAEQLQIERFFGLVADTFEKRENWEIRDETPEGTPFQLFSPNRLDSAKDINEVKDYATIAEHVFKKTRDETPETTVTINVANFEVAISLIHQLQESVTVPISEWGTFAIIRESSIEGGSPDVLFRIRDRTSSAEIAGSTERRHLPEVSSSTDNDSLNSSELEQRDESDSIMERIERSAVSRIWKQAVGSVVHRPTLVGGIVLLVVATMADSVLLQILGLITVFASVEFPEVR